MSKLNKRCCLHQFQAKITQNFYNSSLREIKFSFSANFNEFQNPLGVNSSTVSSLISPRLKPLMLRYVNLSYAVGFHFTPSIVGMLKILLIRKLAA
jgi:hypothetical protein